MHRDLQRTARVFAFFDFVIAEIKDFRSIQRATEVEKSRNQPDRFSLQRALQGTT
jgi:hypothetical protein